MMQGRWRVFRHEAGQTAGPPAWAYVALFCASLLLGLWSAGKFGAVVMWAANGVLLAAYLQLHQRKAVVVLAICFAINLMANVVRGDDMPYLWLNVVLNFIQIVIAGVIARRVCGAALDLSRPRRLAFFAVAAVTPAVLFCTLVNVSLASILKDYSTDLYVFTFQRYFAMEALGLLTVTPVLLLLARRHRFADDEANGRRLEIAALFAAVTLVTTAVFAQSSAPLMFLVFPPLLLLVFRTSPTGSAAAVLLVTLIGGFATLHGHGPVTLQRLPETPDLAHIPDLVRQLNVFYAFLLAVVITALPVSTIVSERRRMVARLQARTQAAQAARRQAEAADAAKSRFLALMSHEMRTPLHGVVGYAEVLARRPGLARDARHQVEQIQASGKALLTLVEDVLEVSRGESISCIDAVDPGELLTQAAAASRDCASAKGLTIHTVVAPGAEAAVLGDLRHLRQILHRLISNAVKFTERGSVTVTASRDGDWTVLRIADTGPGIDASLASRLFQPFVQGDDSIGRSHVGAGLGLAVARRLARALGGDIALETTTPTGSTFAVSLPLPLAEVEASAAPRPLSETAFPDPSAKAPCVLVVDDHPTNREVARLMLAPLGCEIFEAADGIEAVDLASAKAFDLILMDVRMPRMDGLAATRAIRALPGPGGQAPILAVTADAMPEDAARCLAAGMNGHLAKPITHASLYAAIDAVTANGTAMDDTAAA